MKRAMIILALIIFVFVGWAQNVSAVVLINEILADPPKIGGDANGDGSVSSKNDEFIEIVNFGNSVIDISQ